MERDLTTTVDQDIRLWKLLWSRGGHHCPIAVSLLEDIERPVDSFAVSLSDCYLDLLLILFLDRETIMLSNVDSVWSPH